ncbi:hypothetical protein ACVXHB_16125 [Escherichia coli]
MLLKALVLSKLLAVKSRNRVADGSTTRIRFQICRGGLGELKRRLLFVIGALIVFRTGSFIPIPGIDAAVLPNCLSDDGAALIEMLTCSLVVLSAVLCLLWGSCIYFGVNHYPAADGGSPNIRRLRKEGSLVDRKISQYARCVLSYGEYSSEWVLLPVCRICLVLRGLVIKPGLCILLTLL